MPTAPSAKRWFQRPDQIIEVGCHGDHVNGPRASEAASPQAAGMYANFVMPRMSLRGVQETLEVIRFVEEGHMTRSYLAAVGTVILAFLISCSGASAQVQTGGPWPRMPTIPNLAPTVPNSTPDPSWRQ